MSRRSRMHHGDEFGQQSSGNATIGMNGPIIGAGAMITIDGMVERESGVTPPPPPFSVRTAVIFLVVMFIVGVIAVTVLLQFGPGGAARQDTGRVENSAPAGSGSTGQ
jgi:hypothetical protein